MAADPESFSLLTVLGGAAATVATPIVWLWQKLDKKADKHAVNNQMQEVKTEFALHRSYFAKCFDQMREMDQKAADRHAELLEKIYEGRK